MGKAWASQVKAMVVFSGECIPKEVATDENDGLLKPTGSKILTLWKVYNIYKFECFGIKSFPFNRF